MCCAHDMSQCVETACEVIRRLVEDLAPSGYLRYGMEVLIPSSLGCDLAR